MYRARPQAGIADSCADQRVVQAGPRAGAPDGDLAHVRQVEQPGGWLARPGALRSRCGSAPASASRRSRSSWRRGAHGRRAAVSPAASRSRAWSSGALQDRSGGWPVRAGPGGPDQTGPPDDGASPGGVAPGQLTGRGARAGAGEAARRADDGNLRPAARQWLLSGPSPRPQHSRRSVTAAFSMNSRSGVRTYVVLVTVRIVLGIYPGGHHGGGSLGRHSSPPRARICRPGPVGGSPLRPVPRGSDHDHPHLPYHAAACVCAAAVVVVHRRHRAGAASRPPPPASPRRARAGRTRRRPGAGEAGKSRGPRRPGAARDAARVGQPARWLRADPDAAQASAAGADLRRVRDRGGLGQHRAEREPGGGQRHLRGRVGGQATVYYCNTSGQDGYYPPVNCSGTYDRGLWQIDNQAWTTISDACAFTARGATRTAPTGSAGTARASPRGRPTPAGSTPTTWPTRRRPWAACTSARSRRGRRRVPVPGQVRPGCGRRHRRVRQWHPAPAMGHLRADHPGMAPTASAVASAARNANARAAAVRRRRRAAVGARRATASCAMPGPGAACVTRAASTSSGRRAGRRRPRAARRGSRLWCGALGRPFDGSADMELLSDTDVGAELATLPGWTREGDAITGTVKLADFRAADALRGCGGVPG